MFSPLPVPSFSSSSSPFLLVDSKFEVLILPSVFPSHKTPAYVYIYNFSYENWEDEQEITCICWLVSFRTLTEVYFTWAYVLCFWGPLCEMRESTLWISRKQFFLFFYFNFFVVGEPHYFWISCSQRCVGLKMLSIITTLLQSLGLKGMGVCWAVFFV